MAGIASVEGIGTKYAAILVKAGVRNTQGLLDSGATAKGRAALASATGISEKLLLEWVNRVDLMRIRGIGTQFSDLLEAAGVDSVPELAQRKAANLVSALSDVNTKKRLVRQLPSTSTVEKWVASAKNLPKIVKH